MDFTRKYIKMCEKAREIQGKWKPRVGDWVVDVWNKERPLVICAISDSRKYLYLSSQLASSKDNIYLNHISKVFCIFTQDQLQDLRNPNNFFWDLMAMEEVLREMKRAYGILLSSPYFSSGEQFWLANVMWVKYKKIWDEDKEKWIKKE